MAMFGHRGFGTEPMDMSVGASTYGFQPHGFQPLCPSAAQSAQPQNPVPVQRYLPYLAPGDAYPRGSKGPGLRMVAERRFNPRCELGHPQLACDPVIVMALGPTRPRQRFQLTVDEVDQGRWDPWKHPSGTHSSTI